MIRILVIDDDPCMVKILGNVVTTMGHEPMLAESGAEACSLLDSYSFKLILLDLGLPDTNGKLLLHKIRTSIEHSQVPVLIVTAQSDLTIADELRMCGADGFLTKPFQRETLISYIENLLPPVHNIVVA